MLCCMMNRRKKAFDKKKHFRYYEKLRKLLLESIREYVILNESEGGGKI